MAPPAESIRPSTIAGGDPRLLELIGDTVGLLEIDEFRRGLLDALRRAVPADWIGLNDIGPDPQSILVIIDPPAPTDLLKKFKRYSAENPLIQRYVRTRDGRALRFSDVISADQLHALDIYQQVYKPMGIEHQIAFTLPTDADRILGVALARSDVDFTDAELDLLNAARPFLIQAYGNALRYSNLLAGKGRARPDQPAPEIERLVALGLTCRQAQVLQLMAAGATERDIATHLQISQRTVQKHLERCYRTLAVENRSQATNLAWATINTTSENERIHRPRTG